MTTARSLLVLAVAGATLLPAAQGQTLIPVDWDLAFDSRGDPAEPTTPPLLAVPGEGWTAAGPALAIDHPEAFAVTSGDLDADGSPDLLTAGIFHVAGELPGHEELGVSTAKVTYMGWSHGGWAERGTEPLYPSDGSYNARLGDVNQDGLLDILITRRLGAATPADTSLWDVILLNRDRSEPGAPRFRNYVHLRPTAESAPGVLPAHHRQTFGSEFLDADLDGALEVVTSGWYGLRYYDLDPAALAVDSLPESDAPNELPFHTAYPEPFAFDDGDPSVFGGPGGAPVEGTQDGDSYTQFAVGDVDGDSDIDIVAPHNRTGALPPQDTREPVSVFLNTLCDDGDCADGFESGRGGAPEPFRVVVPVDPDSRVFSPDPGVVTTWVAGSDCDPGIPFVLGAERASPLPRSTFEAALGDLDGDGDLDLVLANLGAPNTAYLNDGTGSFGSRNRTTAAQVENDGLPAHVFRSATWDWTGTSRSLDVMGFVDPFVFQGQEVAGQVLPVALDPGRDCRWQHAWPGFGFDHTTGVALSDLDLDGVVDLVGFSNRADWADATLTLLAVISDRPQSFPAWHALSDEERAEYLLIFSDETDTNPTARFTDHVFTNTSFVDGQGESVVRFADTVELIGGHVDGTAYGEFRPWMMPERTPNPGGADHVTLLDGDFGFGPFDYSSAPAWLDANFENTGVSFFLDWPEGAEVGGNHVLWGQTAQLADIDHVAQWVAGPDGPATIDVDLRLMLTRALGAYNKTSLASAAAAPSSSDVPLPQPGPGQLGWAVLVSASGQYPESTGPSFGAQGWRLTATPGTTIGPLSVDEVLVHDELSRRHDGSLGPRSLRALSGVFPLPPSEDADPTRPHIVELRASLRREELTSRTGAGLTDQIADGDELYLAVAVFEGPLEAPEVLWISNAVRVPLELPVVDD